MFFETSGLNCTDVKRHHGNAQGIDLIGMDAISRQLLDFFRIFVHSHRLIGDRFIGNKCLRYQREKELRGFSTVILNEALVRDLV